MSVDLLRGGRQVVAYNIAVYRRSWRGSVMVSFISPVLFLAAMGVGLGNLVRRGAGGVGGVGYLDFLAPGLMAATAMQTAMVETSYPIMARVKWNRIYEGMLATPLRVADLLAGEVAWLMARLLMVAMLFMAVMVIFGVATTPRTLLAIPCAALTGMAFGTPILAFSATQENDGGFSALNRFVVLPLFLLGGAFFPIGQLPRVLQGVAWMTPLAHGVALTRDVVLGAGDAASVAAHVAVPLAYAVAGVMVARAALRRRLVR